MPDLKGPTKERGCDGKINLGLKRYVIQADKLAIKHRKVYGVYSCPHCNGTHLTTKLSMQDQYPALLYVTSNQQNI